MYKRLFILILTTFFFLYPLKEIAANAFTQTTRFVSINGIDQGDCTTSQTPCRSIQYAINKSVSGDMILVSEGTYTYNQNSDTCSFLRTRAVVCSLDKRLTILGGYTDNNWYGSDPTNNITIIDGSSNYRGVAAIGYNTTNAHLEMIGFIIQNSRAFGPTYLNPYDPSGVGAGMLVQHASVTLRDIIIRNNQAIGANTGSGAGGQADGAGLRIEEPPIGTTSILQRVVFENNTSFGGNGPDRGGVAFGALYSYKAKVIIEDSKFINNVAQAGSTTGVGIFNNLSADALGGGIAIMEGDVTITNVEVTDNRVLGGNGTKYGGGAYGGGIFIEDFGARVTTVKITDSSIARNQAIAGNGAIGGNGAGGGIDVDSSNITINRTSIIQNTVIGGNGATVGPGAGGGLYVFKVRDGEFTATLSDVIIANNYADQGRIGTGSLGNGGGGGVVIHGINATIQNSTIAANEIGSTLVLGQGFLIQPWPSPDVVDYNAKLVLSNSIIANHQKDNIPAIVVQKNSELLFDHGLFSGNSKNINSDGKPVLNGSINGLETIDSSPDAGFVAPIDPYYNYHLRQGSIARDKFSEILSPFDIDYQSRLYGSNVDYGADEYHPFYLSIVPGDTQLLGDWSKSIQTFNGVDLHYEITVFCEDGANPPNQLSCNKVKNIGSITNYLLTDLTNFKIYTIKINALSLDNQLIASSAETRAFSTSIFFFLPVISK
ncbi:MAG: hypothetical protein CVU40_10275 [Chloroflexi bacterium HGW-Chloroflexi-2]|jgi:hypothetical protein|nr:MAG: hypothetical protein CVU40_10275 [Chloroflexi bacterium HGW-Chloroflexi-2]